MALMAMGAPNLVRNRRNCAPRYVLLSRNVVAAILKAILIGLLVGSRPFPSGRSRSSCAWCWTRLWSKIGASMCTTTSRFPDFRIRSNKECQPNTIYVTNIELVGAFKNAGRRWRPRGRPMEVIPSLGKGKVIPYGAYDIARDRAVVNVGITHDAAEFAVESIRRMRS